jgi:hypothetical protein
MKRSRMGGLRLFSPHRWSDTIGVPTLQASKNKALDILFDREQDNDEGLAELERLFLTNLTCTRSHKKELI